MASWLVRAVGAVAPGMALRMLANQSRLKSYLAASKSGANKGWIPTTKSADSILAQDRAMITARARDLVRNSSHVAGAIEKIVNNAIYTGIHPQAQFRQANGVLNDKKSDRIEAHFEAWAEAVAFYDLQSLALRHELIDGECLVLMFLDDDLKARGLCPLNLEILEADYLDTTKDQDATKTENRIKGGIEFSKRGKPVAYHILHQHPGESLHYGMESRRIEAEWVIHLFRPERATQTRGVSRLASIIMEMRDFAEYQGSERIAARLAAAFGIFVESPYPEHGLMHPIMDDASQEAADAIPKYLESGRIDVLPPGMKVSVAENRRPGSNYDAFSRTSLRGASAGAGLSYETFSNDYSTATYSSARAATLEERRGYRTMQAHLNRRLNGPIWSAFCRHLSVSGIMSLAGQPVPVIWQNPGWPWVDPAKDGKAAELELSLGITTRRKLAAERGMDWDEVIEELAAEEAKIKALGVTLGDTGGKDETTDPDAGDERPAVDQ